MADAGTLSYLEELQAISRPAEEDPSEAISSNQKQTISRPAEEEVAEDDGGTTTQGEGEAAGGVGVAGGGVGVAGGEGGGGGGGGASAPRAAPRGLRRQSRERRIERWRERLPLLDEDPAEWELPRRPPGEEHDEPDCL